MEYFDTFKDIDGHIERLNEYNPTIIVAPPSLLLMLAKKIEEGKLKTFVKKVVSVAEILEKPDEEYIKKQFNLKVIHQIYQATEGFLACTCEYGHLHLNEDLIKFDRKYIDAKRFYPIITDFRRTSQPFVNYYLNDILVESEEPCECGSVLQRIEKIEGRSDDIFRFRNKFDKEITVFPDFIRRTILFAENIREYQVFQVNSNLLEIAILNINNEQEKLVKKEFDKLFDSLDIENVEIRFIDYKTDSNKKIKKDNKKGYRMRRIQFKGYGIELPKNTVELKGQVRYRISEGESQISLAVSACEKALKNANITINDIDCIVSASAVGIQPIPCTAALIHEKIAKGTSIPALDINTTCTSFITALDTMSYLIEAGRYERVLIVSCDVASIALNPKQKESFQLFSDGAAAFVIEKTEKEIGVIDAIQKTWSEGAHSTEIRGGLSNFHPKNYSEMTKEEYMFDMNGKTVLSLSISKIPELMKNFLKIME